MRFNFVSEKGEGLGLATHLSSEGHAVDLAVGTNTLLGEGIVKRVSQIPQQVSDVYVFDSDIMGQEADEYREAGYRVLGASHWSEMLSKDPDYMAKVIKLIGWDQDTVTNGINLYITTWFNGAHFISTYASLVYRRFMSGGRGPDVNFTGVVGNFYQPCERIEREILQPLSRVLKRVNHKGCFHTHAIITGDKFSVKEVSASFTSPLSLILYENTKTSKSDILLKLFDETSKPIVSLDQWAVGLLVSVPPYPYMENPQSVIIKGLQEPALKHLWFVDAMKEGNEWKTAATNGKLGYVTSRGASVHEAVKRVYRTVGNFQIRDIQYRDDVGTNLNSLLDNLKSYGWLK
jgi:hypothetical protein